jgi:hypothetical protein
MSVPTKGVKITDKFKVALDETRMLILGAQIFLGFQFRSAFEQKFEELPRASSWLDAGAVLLLVTTVSILIAPGPYHRIVGDGHDRADIHDVITHMASSALLPFAAALGVAVYMAIERIGGTVVAAVGGIAFVALALFWWYGFSSLRKQREGLSQRSSWAERNGEVMDTPLHIRIDQLLTEARVILPGTQALLGFQLAIVLTDAFSNLPEVSKLVHAVSLCLAALAVILLMTPAAYHRIVYAGEDSPEFHRVASIIVTCATIPFAFGLAGDVYVVVVRMTGSAALAAWSGLGSFILCGTLWYVYPIIQRTRRNVSQINL